jgi:hypothetical protein
MGFMVAHVWAMPGNATTHTFDEAQRLGMRVVVELADAYRGTKPFLPTVREHVLGAPVRGFTRGGLAEFVEADGYFRVVESRGSNFCPLPPRAARPLSRWLPSLAVGLFVRCQRTGRPGCLSEVLRTRQLETPYLLGDAGSDASRPPG